MEEQERRPELRVEELIGESRGQEKIFKNKKFSAIIGKLCLSEKKHLGKLICGLKNVGQKKLVNHQNFSCNKVTY